jgi:hypothetical protein
LAYSDPPAITGHAPPLLRRAGRGGRRPDIASGDLTVTLEGGDATKLRLERDREYGPTNATVLLRNPTSKPATVKLWAWLEDGQPIAITKVKNHNIDLMASSRNGVSKLDNRGEFSLPAKSVVPVTVTFEHLTKSSSTKGHLALGGPSVSTVSVVGLSFERPTPPWYLWTPLVAGALLAVLLTSARFATLQQRKQEHTHLPPNQKWTFKDGWASNIVVVGTVVITIIGAVGSLGSEALGDFSVADFVGLNLVFGSMVLVSPLVYSALRTKVPKDEEHEKTTIAGTVVGLLVGAAAILWAAFGQLASLFILVLSAPHEWQEFVLEVFLILLAGGFVFIYSWKTLGWTVNGYAELTEQDEKAPKTVPELQRAAVEYPELTTI